MQYGLYAMNYGSCAEPDNVVRVAEHAEAAGFESLWTGEHFALPDPKRDWFTMEPTLPYLDAIVALTLMATHTETIKIAAGVFELPLHSPVMLAKQLTSIDRVSKGRLLAGVGVGYLEAEYAAFGVPLSERGSRTDEYIDAMRALWTMPAPEYRGRHVTIAGVDSAGWDVLVDAAAFVPTNRLDVANLRPDFVTLSFYKMMGFPTGVGCLLARRDRLAMLERPWFAGGTITIASVQGDGHYLHQGEAGFEDGTVDYLNLPAVSIGLDHIERVGRESTHQRVGALTGWVLEAFTGLRHANGRSLVTILGPTDTTERGGTISFQVHDRDGRPVDDRRIEELANHAGISLRTGCFCNPGVGEIAHGLGASDMRKWFGGEQPMSFLELRNHLKREHDILVGAVRISLGLASTFADVYRLMCFLQGFVDRTGDEIGRVESTSDNCRIVRDTA